MKKLIILIIPALILGCMASPSDSGELPQDISQLQSLEKETKSEIKELNQRLADIEEKMREVAPEKYKTEGKLITIRPIGLSTFEKYASIQGELKVKDELFISAEAGGRLIKMDLDEGEVVRRGQLVAELDMESVRKQKAEVEKSLELAKELYERRKRLFDQNIGSEVEYLQAKNQVERLEQNIETINHQLTKSNIYAPIRGEVDRVMKESGEVVAPGEPIARVLDPGMLKAVSFVPERYLTAVQRGDSVIVTIPAIGMEKKMRVSRVGATINPQNRTFEVEVDVPNKNGLLKPNLLVNMLIRDYVEEDVIVLPTNYVQQEVSGRYFVYVLDKDAEEPKAEKKYIKTGESYDDMIVIKEGITTDDQLIDEGSRNVTNGELVKIIASVNDTSNQPK